MDPIIRSSRLLGSFAWILALTGSVLAKNYYVSSSLGDDSRTTPTPSAPWKTLSKIDTTVVLWPGDSILLRTGDTIVGSPGIRHKADVVWNKPIVVSSYRSSATDSRTARPVVTGTVRLTGWVRHPTLPSVWQAPFAGQTRIARLFLEGMPQPSARYPDTGWLKMRSPEGDTAIKVPELATGSWVGASIHLRSRPWNLDARRVARQSGERIVLDRKAEATIPEGWGCFVSGIPRAIARAGHWAQDSTTGQILWWPPTGIDPTKANIHISVADYGIRMRGQHDIVVDGIDFFGHRLASIEAMGTPRITIRNCRSAMADQWGFRVYGDSASIVSCRVVGSSEGGIDMLSVGGQVFQDTIERVGSLNWLGPLGMGSQSCGGRGILASGDDSRVRRNVVRWTGWSGIHFDGNRQLIEENVVDSAMQTLNDGGGLYTYNWTKWGLDGVGTLVRRNVVTNTFGNNQGSVYERLGHGLYLDNWIQDLQARENVFVGNTWGVLVHNNRGVKLVRNTFFNDSVQVMLIHDTYSTDQDMYGNTVDSNVMVAVQPGKLVVEGIDVDNHGRIPATYSRNIECTDGSFRTLCLRGADTLVHIPRTLIPSRVVGSNRLVAQSIGLRGWGGYPSSVDVSAPSTAANDSSLVVRYDRRKDSTTPYGLLLRYYGIPVDSGETSYFRFRAKAGKPGMRVMVDFIQSHTPYKRQCAATTFDLDTAWKDYSVVLTTSLKDSSRIQFQFRPADSLVSFANISWQKVDTSGMGKLRYSHHAISAGPENTAFNFSEQGWRSPEGIAIAPFGTVPPFGAVIAFKDPDARTSDSPSMGKLPPRMKTWIAPDRRLRVELPGDAKTNGRFLVRTASGRILESISLSNSERTATLPIQAPRGFSILEFVPDGGGKTLREALIAP